MKVPNLGSTGLRASPPCLGTMNIDPGTTEAEWFTILDRALEGAINFLDAELLNGLDRIFPGLGGLAPEAYAW